jgi:monofunctional biosynthetic peptidoglycan transglycosylase
MARKSASRNPIRRFLRAIAIVLGLIVAVPLVLTPVYAIIDPVSVPILVRRLTGQPVTQQWTPIEQLSDRLKAVVIMSEDGQFCRHWGIDVGALRAEVDDFLAGRPVRGASTISMQVARNLFLWNDRSYFRKMLEIPLAVYLDLVLSKHRIMEIYLNIAEWGPEGEFGVVAGSQRAFGSAPASLTWERAGLLTTALPNPRVRLPGDPSAQVLRVARVIAERGQQFGARASCVGENGALAL